jgi:hypothetical protein
MGYLTSIAKLLPRMIPLGVLTLAVVLAWNRYYTVLASAACEVSATLGSGRCSPGRVDDPQGLLDAAANGRAGKPRCTTLASLSLGSAADCEEPADDAPSCPGRARLPACDPTKWLGLGTSPGLGDCEVVAMSERAPYEFSVQPRARSRGPGCNVTKLRVDASARVTFCFQQLRLKVARGFPGKLALGQEYVDKNPGQYCDAGQLEASYDAAGGLPPTSKLDIVRYALQAPPPSGAPEIVLVPATVSGGPRSDSDDRADFSYSRRALAVARLRRAGNTAPSTAQIAAEMRVIDDYEQQGFTWHHAELLRGADGRYYYRMILVPSAIHDTTPHDGGSAWARSRGINQDPTKLEPAWDPLAPPPSTSPVLERGWPASVSRELPEECRPCQAP